MIWLKKFFAGFKEGMRSFGENIAIIVNSLLLLAVYLLGVGTTSLFARILGKRFLKIKRSKNRGSYWTGLNLKKKPIEEYYRQF